MIFFWILLIIVSGILMGFTHHFRFGEIEIYPSWWTFILSSIGIAVFMKVSSLRARKRVRWGLGFLGGFIYFSITLYWIAIALREFGGLSLPIAAFAALCLAAYCALFYAFWSLIAGFDIVREKPIFLRVIIWASLWAGLEAVREHLFTGFTWGEIGYAFSNIELLAKTASVWGVHGLSFLWIIVVSLLIHIDEWGSHPVLRKQAALLFALISSVGVYAYFSYPLPSKEELRLSLIQPNIQQDMKWNPDRASQNLKLLMELSQKALNEKPDLIVWPETSYPFLVSEGQKQMPFSSPVPSIIGAVVSDRKVNYNSALFLKEDQIQAHFSKIHLVPFGEYVPLENILPFGKLVANAGRFIPGSNEQELFKLRENIELGPLICYEDIFSRHSVRHARAGADVLINMTNDAWYGKSSAQKQHAAMAKFRVYETGLPMVRATNTGLTSTYSIQSSVEIPMEEIGSLTTSLSIPEDYRRTFFVSTYPLMQWIWWLIFAIGLGWKVRYPKKKIFFRE